MKKYIDTVTLAYPITASDIRAEFPFTGFPESLEGVNLSDFNKAPVGAVAPPSFDQAIETVVEKSPVRVAGLYTQAWAVVPLTPEQIEARRVLAVPRSVSPRQIRQALTRTGLRKPLEAAIATADQDTKDWYEFATDFERINDHVIAMGRALGVSDRQLDDLWTLAGAL